MPGSAQQDARRRRAAGAARQWLERVNATEPATVLQCRLGHNWCSWITCDDDAVPAGLLLTANRIPAVAPLELLAFGDGALLRFCSGLATGEGLEWNGSMAASPDCVWEPVLGALAVSAARHGNLLLCAGLLRAAASMGSYGYSQVWAEGFLLDQQASCGSFGHLELETAIVGAGTASSVMLTANVLWSLAAVEHVVRQARPHRVGASSSASLIIRSSSSTARAGQ